MIYVLCKQLKCCENNDRNDKTLRFFSDCPTLSKPTPHCKIWTLFLMVFEWFYVFLFVNVLWCFFLNYYQKVLFIEKTQPIHAFFYNTTILVGPCLNSNYITKKIYIRSRNFETFFKGYFTLKMIEYDN